MKTIQSPEGVALLMENLWFRHKAEMKQRPCKVLRARSDGTDEDILTSIHD